MTELQDRVRERLRQQLLRHGASKALDDPAVFAAVEALLRTATDSAAPAALLLPELLGDPETWRLDTAMRYQSHRAGAGPFIIFVKQRLLMPVLPRVEVLEFEELGHMGPVTHPERVNAAIARFLESA